jgi:hypothetical protein
MRVMEHEGSFFIKHPENRFLGHLYEVIFNDRFTTCYLLTSLKIFVNVNKSFLEHGPENLIILLDYWSTVYSTYWRRRILVIAGQCCTESRTRFWQWSVSLQRCIGYTCRWCSIGDMKKCIWILKLTIMRKWQNQSPMRSTGCFCAFLLAAIVRTSIHDHRLSSFRQRTT